MIRMRKYDLILCAVLTAKSTVSGVNVDVKQSCYPGETLQILISVPSPGTLYFWEFPQTQYAVDGFGPWGSFDMYSEVVAPYTWTNTLRWDVFPLTLGTHYVVGTVKGYGSSPAVSFDVVRPPIPNGNFLVDFDTIPGTTAPVSHLMAYEAAGIHFHTKFGNACRLSNPEGNSWVEGFDRYPSRYNVIADFDLPVVGASAKVAAGTGVQIIMTAKNALGQIIASTNSEPATGPSQFNQTLTLRTSEPIASLEWWPVDPDSRNFGVDDLYIITAPTFTYTVVGMTLRLSWPSAVGASYLVWSSTDMQDWTPYSPVFVGTGSILTYDCSLMESPARYFRLRKSE